jgi:hypothetical protein
MELLHTLLPHLNQALALAAVYLLRKWLHIQVRAEKVQALLDAIVQEVVEVERDPGKTGALKKAEVIEQIANRFQSAVDPVFTPKRLSLLKQVFGTLEIAVEKAFQLSHLSRAK